MTPTRTTAGGAPRRALALAARCAVLVGLAGAAAAQDAAAPSDPAEDAAHRALPDGLWVFGDSCAAAAMDLVEDGIVLTGRGTKAPQSSCDFVDVMPGGDNRWAIVELCTGRDSTFARLSSLVILENGDAVLASETGGELEFDRCPDPEPEAEPEAETTDLPAGEAAGEAAEESEDASDGAVEETADDAAGEASDPENAADTAAEGAGN